jgi:hypothetical protein
MKPFKISDKDMSISEYIMAGSVVYQIVIYWESNHAW